MWGEGLLFHAPKATVYQVSQGEASGQVVCVFLCHPSPDSSS